MNGHWRAALYKLPVGNTIKKDTIEH